jgi:hypothetical protein
MRKSGGSPEWKPRRWNSPVDCRPDLGFARPLEPPCLSVGNGVGKPVSRAVTPLNERLAGDRIHGDSTLSPAAGSAVARVVDLTVSQLLPNWIVFEGTRRIKWPIFLSFASGLRRQGRLASVHPCGRREGGLDASLAELGHMWRSAVKPAIKWRNRPTIVTSPGKFWLRYTKGSQCKRRKDSLPIPGRMQGLGSQRYPHAVSPSPGA